MNCITLKQDRIERDYQALRNLCSELDWRYSNSLAPEEGFRVGHYNDERYEIQLYSVLTEQIPQLKKALSKVAINYDNSFLKKYKLYQSRIDEDTWLIMLRPRLLN